MYCLQAVLGVGVSVPSQAVSVLKDVPKDLLFAQKGCCHVWQDVMFSNCSQPHGLTLGRPSLKSPLCHIAPPGT